MDDFTAGATALRQHGALVAALREVADSLAETRDCALGNDPDGWAAVQNARAVLALADASPQQETK